MVFLLIQYPSCEPIAIRSISHEPSITSLVFRKNNHLSEKLRMRMVVNPSLMSLSKHETGARHMTMGVEATT